MQSASSPGLDAPQRSGGGVWRGIWAGMTPLVLLIVAIAITVALTALARILSASFGFLVWQWIVAGVWIAGLLISAACYGYAAFRALRQALAWRREGLTTLATAAFWALGATALIVLLPTLLALSWPQHPAPPRAP